VYKYLVGRSAPAAGGSDYGHDNRVVAAACREDRHPQPEAAASGAALMPLLWRCVAAINQFPKFCVKVTVYSMLGVCLSLRMVTR
jgi:hypothetical protein